MARMKKEKMDKANREANERIVQWFADAIDAGADIDIDIEPSKSKFGTRK